MALLPHFQQVKWNGKICTRNIRSSNLINTLCDLFRHLFMSPDKPVLHMKLGTFSSFLVTLVWWGELMIWGYLTLRKSEGLNYWMFIVFTKLCLYISDLWFSEDCKAGDHCAFLKIFDAKFCTFLSIYHWMNGYNFPKCYWWS